MILIITSSGTPIIVIVEIRKKGFDKVTNRVPQRPKPIAKESLSSHQLLRKGSCAPKKQWNISSIILLIDIYSIVNMFVYLRSSPFVNGTECKLVGLTSTIREADVEDRLGVSQKN